MKGTWIAVVWLGSLLAAGMTGWTAGNNVRKHSVTEQDMKDEISFTNAVMSRKLQIELNKDASDETSERVYQQWKQQRNATVKEIYQRYDHPLPPSLRD